MKDILIDELIAFNASLNAINATYANIRGANMQDHTQHHNTLNEIMAVLTDIRNRVARFYTADYPYAAALLDVSRILNDFNRYYGETHMIAGATMEDCKNRIIRTVDGIISELRLYDAPSEDDPKFDRP